MHTALTIEGSDSSAVSYTHLAVYKRQTYTLRESNIE